jgi:hypothetical protein
MNSRVWIKQPEGKNQCGQVAIAVIAGISLENAIEIVGKKGCTKTKELIKALHSLGFKCSNRCRKMPRPILGIAQVHVRYSKKDKIWSTNWHWVVVDNDKIFDGFMGNKDGTVNWPSSWEITSYLEIYAGVTGTDF